MTTGLYKKGLVFAVIVLFIGASVVPIIRGHNSVFTDTIIVPDDYPTIQEAIDHANDEDRIEVRAGTYYENVVVDKSINLMGEDKNTTFIDGSGSGSVVHISADGVSVSGFTIRNTSLGSAGLKIYSNYCTIDNNIIKECGDGINLKESEVTTVIRNWITVNNFGIYADLSTHIEIIDNIINMNNDGITLWMSNSVELLKNKIENNSYNGILHLWSNHNQIDGNKIAWNDNFGIQMFNSDSNNIFGNDIVNNVYDGISLHKSCSNAILNNSIISNNNGTSLWYYSNNNMILNNTFSNNDNGISLELSSYNLISNNTISTNKAYGIYSVEASNYNLFHLNVLKSNGINAWDNSINNWDNGSVGNYWDDYTGTDANGDGIGDTPHPIPGGNNRDNYPLILNELPILEITYPEEGDCVRGTIIINGMANDPDGTVELVEVRIDDGEWETAQTTNNWQNWSYEWNTETVDDGPHKIYARGKDDNGAYSKEYRVNVRVDNTYPVVDIVRPREGFIYIQNVETFPFFMTIVIGKITVQVEVTEVGSGINRVEFYVNSDLKGIGLWNPIKQYWEWDWDEFRCGLCNLEVIILDNCGNSGYDEIGLFYCNIPGLPLP